MFRGRGSRVPKSIFGIMEDKICVDCQLTYQRLLKFGRCRLCNMIQNLHPRYMNELILYHSKYDQNTILRRTRDFILRHRRAPLPAEIDPRATLARDPLYKYDAKKGHRVFVTNLFNFSYIIKVKFGDGLCDLSLDGDKYQPERYLLDDSIVRCV